MPSLQHSVGVTDPGRVSLRSPRGSGVTCGAVLPEPHSKEGQSQKEGEGNGVSLEKAPPHNLQRRPWESRDGRKVDFPG